PRAKLVELAKTESVHAMFHDLALSTAVEDDRHTAILHRFNRRHAEVLDEMRIHFAQTAGVPEDRSPAVPVPQLRQGGVYPHVDRLRAAARVAADAFEVGIGFDRPANEN